MHYDRECVSHMNNTYKALFEAIQARCQRQSWYGPDMESPAQLRSYLGDDSDGSFFWYDRNGKQYVISKDSDIDLLPVPHAFEYPPATEEQLLATEELLGFTLPSLLRSLYSQIANGGFGPGYGLNGVVGGFGQMVTGYLSCKKTLRLVDFNIFEERKDLPGFIPIPDYVWPDRFLELCHWGCAIYSFLDANTGRVFRGFVGSEYKFGFEYESSSLMEWLQLWTKDELKF